MKLCLIAVLLMILFTPSMVLSQTKAPDSTQWYAIKMSYPGLATGPGPGTSCMPVYTHKEPIRTSVSPMMRTSTENDPTNSVTSILLTAAPKGDDWELRVSVVFGGLYNQGKKRIATRRVQLGETIQIEELAQVGLRPFALSVVPLQHGDAVQPELINDLQTIKVAGFEVSAIPTPHILTVKNLSDKDIQKLQINILFGADLRAERLPTGDWNQPLIKAHGTRKILIPSNLGTAGAPDPCAAQLLSLRFASVIFADGSYEGEPFWAASQQATVVGNRVQLGKVLSLIDEALTTPEPDPAQILQRLKASAMTLDESVPAEGLHGLNVAFPTLADPETNLIGHARAGMDKVKCALRDDLNRLERTEATELSSAFPAWLQKEKEKYQRWRATLR